MPTDDHVDSRQTLQTPTAEKSAMPLALVWKARPIFLSSTFRDMHAERDYLRGRAFPRLGEQLRERCHYLDTIDLRQGVEQAQSADEATREMQVLKVCLLEIERSKPFFVALLGDRYGWIPPAERITAAARDAGLPATVDVAGKSVTELEILYGVLENPDQRKRSWFYFRTLDRAGMPPEVATRFPAETPSDDPSSPAGKLRTLKDRLRRELPDRVREYTLQWDPAKQAFAGLDDLDALVARDLWSDLDTETTAYLRQAPRTWQEADTRAVIDFVAERTRGYVERPAVTDPMIEHALSGSTAGAAASAGLSTDWGMVVTGESGGGKSSLFGRVFDALQPRAASGEIVLLAHAAGIFPLSSQVDRMLKRWITELAARLGEPDPLERPAAPAQDAGSEARRPDTPIVTSEEIDKIFAELLGRVSAQTHVVVFIDALNQFEPTVRAQYITWLPKPWPDNVRFLATAIPCQATAALNEHPGFRERPVPAVSSAEAVNIARRFYRERHHHDVNPRVLDALLDKKQSDSRPAHANPLWLALALQEMNLLEADDFERADREFAHLHGPARMEALQLSEAVQLPADVPGVYSELLERAERGFGKAWADAFVNLVALGRAGWRESDLRELMPKVSGQPWDELAFAGVRRALGAHVVQRGAQAQWDFFHAALRDTVLARNLADESERRHLHGLLVDHLEALPPGDPLRISETVVHLLGLGERDRSAGYLAGITSLQSVDAYAKATLAGAVTALVEAIQAAPDDAARDQLTGWIASLMGVDDNDQAGRVANAVIFNLNDALAVTGEARTERSRDRLLQAARTALERLVQSEPSNVGWRRDLSVSQERIGDVLLAQGNLGEALTAYRQSLAVTERLAQSDPSNVGCQWDLSVRFDRIGNVLRAQGNLGEALTAYRKTQTILERLAQSDPSNAGCQRDLSVSHSKIGNVLRAQGNLGEAFTAYRKTQTILERLAQSDPSNAGWQRDLSIIFGWIGDVLLEQGNLGAALTSYRKTQTILERLAQSDPSNAGWQRDLSVSQYNIGEVLLAQGNLGEALTAYRQSLAIRERLAQSDPSNAGWQRDLSVSQEKIGDVLRVQGNLGEALTSYQQSLAVAESLAQSDPTNVYWQRDLSVSQYNIGEVLLAQGNLGEALTAYRQSLAIRERLAQSDPSNTGWQWDLSASHSRIGNVLRAQGNLSEALTACRRSLVIVERLAESDTSNSSWQRDLSVIYNKIGDVLLEQGNLGAALTSYRKTQTILERLAQSDPSNAGWQRDLFVSYTRLALAVGGSTPSEARLWWHRCYEQILAMKRRGILAPPDERLLEFARQKAGE